MAELEDKGEIRRLLEAVIEAEPQGKKSSGLRAQIAEQRELIIKALRMGHSATAIARHFHENGLGSSVDTLRAYVAEAAGRRRTSRVKKTAKSASKAVSKRMKQTRAEPSAESLAESQLVTHELEASSDSPKPFGIAGRKF
jgi:hypothetical protein